MEQLHCFHLEHMHVSLMHIDPHFMLKCSNDSQKFMQINDSNSYFDLIFFYLILIKVSLQIEFDLDIKVELIHHILS
jgi:hypothetical protein